MFFKKKGGFYVCWLRHTASFMYGFLRPGKNNILKGNCCFFSFPNISNMKIFISSGVINPKKHFRIFFIFLSCKNNRPHQRQPFCQSVMWPKGAAPPGPQTLAAASEVPMGRYVGAFTCRVCETWLLLTACLFSVHLAGAKLWTPPRWQGCTRLCKRPNITA